MSEISWSGGEAPAVRFNQAPVRFSSPAALLFRQLKRDKLALAGIAFVLVVAIIALLAPALPIVDPNATRSKARLSPSGVEGYVLGSDHLGRDILSRLIWGGRVSLAVGLGAALIAMAVGSAMGLVSGYFRGAMDHIIMRFLKLKLSIDEFCPYRNLTKGIPAKSKVQPHPDAR